MSVGDAWDFGAVLSNHQMPLSPPCILMTFAILKCLHGSQLDSPHRENVKDYYLLNCTEAY